MDTYLTIEQAARMAHVTETLLFHAIENGIIQASYLNGSMIVKQTDVLGILPKNEQPEYQQFAHLAGQGIGMREASREYGINHVTISRWVERGYITVVGREGRKVLIDRADIAYCAYVYHSKPGQGHWLFTKEGTPYQKKS